jgi:adenine-specific DNA-methyltransferase
MPTLNWIGKEAVVNHHQQVPFRLLKDLPALACGDPGSGNLIVQGDNLEALKALLPYYAGQVKCIYIDPPYNTGNEGWAYNDNVNSPVIRDWLGKTVGKEGETLDRHDRWLCMMYPRLALLRQFLRDDGSIFVSIDDNEVHTLRFLMDEIFGSQCFLADVIWRSSDSSNHDAKTFSVDHNHTIVYSREAKWTANQLARSEESNAHYRNPDDDPRGPWFPGNLSSPNPRPNLRYKVTSPTGVLIEPPANGWRWREERMNEMISTGEIAFSPDGARLIKKTYLEGQSGLAPSTLWADIDETGHNRNAKYELKKLFPENNTSELFKTPKPPKFLEKILQVATNPGDLVLDSFAGSGTTGHAVLKMNAAAQDTPQRRFILVEMETEIARDVTAERVRRVAQGYTNAKGEAVAGIGGSFRFCELGEPLFDETGMIRETVKFSELARHVYFSETGEPLPRARVLNTPFLGACRGVGIYLLYNGILGDESANGGNVLTRQILAKLPEFDGPKVVYCAGCLLSRDRLQGARITVRQTPYEIKVS